MPSQIYDTLKEMLSAVECGTTLGQEVQILPNSMSEEQMLPVT